MIARELPREEWGRLKGPGIDGLEACARPEDVKAVVVERDGELIAQCLVLRMTHIEGVWIDPEHRNGGVVGALLRQTSRAASEWSSDSVIAGAADGDERMLGILARLGAVRLPLGFFALRIAGE